MIEGRVYQEDKRKSIQSEKGLQDRIESYIFDTIDGYINAGQDIISVRNLFGGENRDWNGTPLQEVYNFHRAKGYNHEKAHRLAAIDIGYQLKDVLIKDEKRTYRYIGKDTGNKYQWIK